MPLTDTAVRNARGAKKAFKMHDGEGLYLLVKPNNGRYWRFNYRYQGKHLTLALGVYPEVSLVHARDQRRGAKAALAAGKNPSVEKREARTVAKIAAENTFRVVGEEWFQKKLVDGKRSDSTLSKNRWMLDMAYLEFGDDPIDQIEPPKILELLVKIEKRGLHDTAMRVRAMIGRVFRYAIATLRAKRDPTRDLAGALTTPTRTHHATLLDPVKIGGLLRAIDGYEGEYQVRAAMRLAPYLFVRPYELRTAEWTEFYWDAADWRLPDWKMKMRRVHIVPLPRQAMTILSDLKERAMRGKYLFGSLRGKGQPMSNATVNAALRRMGYAHEEQTCHGFRTMASTLLNEMGWNKDWVERQLAHVEENSSRRAYNAAQYLPDRRRMMQAWADYLDTLKASV